MAKIIQLTQNGVMKYPRTIADAIAVVSKSKKLSTVLAELEAEDLRLLGLINAAQGQIDTLVGSGDGSVDKKISEAINDFATKITDNGAIDSFKELVDYVAAHGPEFSALVGRVGTVEGKVSTLEGKVSTLEGDNTTNKANIQGNTEAIGTINGKLGSSADESNADGSIYARIKALKEEVAAMGGDQGSIKTQIDNAIAANNTSVVTPISNRVGVIEGDYLKGADKTELQGKIDEKVAQSAYDTKVQALETAAANAQSSADAANTAASNAQSKADSAYTLAEGKIGYTVVGDATYPDFDEIALS